MDKIQKFINRLPAPLDERVTRAIRMIESGMLSNLDVKQMKGAQDIYRCRISTVRIIFLKAPLGNVVTAVDFRDKVYKKKR